jgi:hypothetical protein
LLGPGLKGWRGPYIKPERLIDPWKQPYKFSNYVNSEIPSFVASLGRNRKWETLKIDIKERKSAGDDIIEWLQGK